MKQTFTPAPWWSSVVLVVLLASQALALASPQAALAAALADCQAQPPAARPYLRYLTLYAVPARDRTLWVKVLTFQLNSLSRGANLEVPRLIGPDLLAVNVAPFGKTFARTYEKLADVDPYFHVRVKQVREEVEDWPGGIDPKEGRYYKPGRYKTGRTREVVRTAAAPWLAVGAITELIALTHSQAPVLRGDWFFAQTSIQAGRKGTGYYDFLGLKSRTDFERLVGLDVKRAQEVKREVAAILRRSGVSSNNRQIFRFGAVDAGYWQTRDVFDTSTEERNAVTNLDDDFKHQAERHYGFLPNRLFAYYLSDAQGVQQDTAPDRVGPDTTSTSNDGRIHVMLSCVRCHVEGIRPIKDYARQLYQVTARGGLVLQAPDPERLERLRQLYLGPLERLVVRDRQDFAETLFGLTGWKTAQLAASYKRAWEWYTDTDVSLNQAALELGVPVQDLTGALKASALSTGSLNPVLAGLLSEESEGILRDQWEEVYPLAQTLLKGYVP